MQPTGPVKIRPAPGSIQSPKPAIRARLDFGRMGAHIIVAALAIVGDDPPTRRRFLPPFHGQFVQRREISV